MFVELISLQTTLPYTIFVSHKNGAAGILTRFFIYLKDLNLQIETPKDKKPIYVDHQQQSF